MPLRQNTPSHWLILVLAELSKIKRKIAVSRTTIRCPDEWGKLQYRHPIGRVSTVREFFSRKIHPAVGRGQKRWISSDSKQTAFTAMD